LSSSWKTKKGGERYPLSVVVTVMQLSEGGMEASCEVKSGSNKVASA